MFVQDQSAQETYRRINLYLSQVLRHIKVPVEDCKRNRTQNPPALSAFLAPLHKALYEFGFSYRNITELIPSGLSLVEIGRNIRDRVPHQARRAYKNAQHSLKQEGKALQTSWSGINLSEDGKVISELTINGKILQNVLDNIENPS